jgi:hypothetical protein
MSQSKTQKIMLKNIGHGLEWQNPAEMEAKWPKRSTFEGHVEVVGDSTFPVS